MTLFDKLRGFLRRDPPSCGLRNKPGGLARICMPRGNGVEDLNGQYVTTVRTVWSSVWEIDPPVSFVATGPVHIVCSGVVHLPGDVVRVTALGDQYLIPVPPVPDGAVDESMRWLPPVPVGKPRKVQA